MAKFTGQLRSNEIFSALYNQIISIQTFADNIKGTNSTLVDKARVDGSMYGDSKVYTSTDVLSSAVWGNDAEAENLLKLHRPKAPEQQVIYLDQFRQIRLTVDNYLSKRAWGSEHAFGQFNSVMKAWIGDTKRIYDSTLYNTFIGTHTGASKKSNIGITLPTNADPEVQARLQAQTIAESIANLITEMTDVSRDFNDYGQLRSYSEGEIKFVWNSKYVNKIKYMDLPTIFHNDNLIKKFGENVLPSRYFGDVVESGTADGTTHRALIEADFTGTDGTPVHCFPGDIIPKGASLAQIEDEYTKQQKPVAYKENDKVICKVLTDLPPYMSGFEVGTSFFNPRALTETNFLTFGYNTLRYLKAKPYLTIKAN